MKFLKVSTQLALNLDKIEAFRIRLREDTTVIEAIMDSGMSIVISRHGDIRLAEIALLDLVDRLENGRGERIPEAFCGDTDSHPGHQYQAANPKVCPGIP